jgi:UDP-glucose 4-epimerase
MRIAPFDDETQRRNLIDRLNRISGIAIPHEAAKRRPSFDMSVLIAEPERRQFLETMQWAIEQARAAQIASPSPADSGVPDE